MRSAMCAIGRYETIRNPSVEKADREAEALDRPADVRVVEHHALRLTRRARRVDDGHEVVGLRDVRGAFEIDGVGTDQRPTTGSSPRARRRPRPCAQVGQRAAHRRAAGRANSPSSTIATWAPAVAGEVQDLLGRRRVVDRDRRRADEERADVGDVELGPVAQEQDDAGARRRPEVGECGGDPSRPVRVLGERERAVGRRPPSSGARPPRPGARRCRGTGSGWSGRRPAPRRRRS